MTATKIIEFARYRLGDTDSTGWSDKRLVDLVDAAQKDFCRRTGVHKKPAYIGVTNFKSIYSLPIDSHQITRVEYDNESLPILSREDWDNVLSKPKLSAIKSDLSMEAIELKPPFDDLDIKNIFIKGSLVPNLFIKMANGVVSNAGGKLLFSSSTGVLSSIVINTSVPASSLFGDIASIFLHNNPIQIANVAPSSGVATSTKPISAIGQLGFTTEIGSVGISGFGVVTDAFLPGEYLTVYYNAVPDTIRTKYTSLVLDNTWEMAMIHYVTGMARQDDNDEGNYKIGEAELTKYENLVERARRDSARSFSTQVDMSRSTIYGRF